MSRLILSVLLIILISSGFGIETVNLLNIKEKGFKSVIGFVVFIALIQILYYPAQIFNLSFNYIIVTSLFLIGVGILLCLKNYKEVIKEFLNYKFLIVIISVLIFSFINSKLYLDIELSDSATYLNYIAQNIDIDKLNMFNPITGVYGSEWDIYYLYQGYYHFASFLCWFVNINSFVFNVGSYLANITVSTWGLGLIYSVFSSMFIINILEYFEIKNKWFLFCVGMYLLFYSNFYYWKIAFSFYGNTYRVVIGALLIFYIYRWIKEGFNDIKHLFPIIIFAGLAFTSSFLFISFVIMFSLAIYLFMIEKEKVIYEMFTFVFPIAFFGIIMFGKVYKVFLIVGIVFISIIYIGRLFKPIRRFMMSIDEFFYKNIKLIIIVTGVVLALASLYINLNIDKYVANYLHYFEDHQKYDMIKDYFFVYSNYLDNILNVIRWIGIVLFVLKAKTNEDKFIKNLILITLLIFLNPLCTSAIAYFLTGIVYYRLIEVIFNPFLELMFIISFYNFLKWNNIGQWCLKLSILFCVILGNVYSFINIDEGLYTFYVKGGKNTTPLEKISYNELQAIYEVKKLVDSSNDENLVVVSQTSALRTFIPYAYQLFSARDYFYDGYRINEDFYQIARRHYSWDPWYLIKDTHYENTCKYLNEYEVDYILLEYWENSEFDVASDACSTTEFTGSNYKVKKVNK